MVTQILNTHPSPPFSEYDGWALACASAGKSVDLRQVSSGIRPLVSVLLSSPPDVQQTLLHHLSSVPGAVQQIFSFDPNVPPYVPLQQQRLLDISELEALPLPEYAVERYPVYARGFNLMYGKPGSGKSLVALDAACLLASSLSAGTVVYAALEGWQGLPVRFRAWEQHRKVTVAGRLKVWKDTLNLLDEKQRTQFKENCRTVGARFIIVDTLVRAMVGVNENDTTAMGLFVDAVDRLRAELDCGILFVHHQSKLGMMRGSTVLEGAADSILKVESKDPQIAVHNALALGGKNKDREEAPTLYLNKLPVQVALSGTIESGVVVEVGEKVIQMAQADALIPVQRSILETLVSSGAGLTASALMEFTSVPKSTLYRNLDQLKAGELVMLNHERYYITDSGRTALSA